MTTGNGQHEMLRHLLRAAELELSSEDLALVGNLHARFAEQRARMSGAARPETEPMIIPAFDRALSEKEARDEPAG